MAKLIHPLQLSGAVMDGTKRDHPPENATNCRLGHLVLRPAERGASVSWGELPGGVPLAVVGQSQRVKARAVSQAVRARLSGMRPFVG